MIDKIIQVVSEFYSKFLSAYVSAYFAWLTEKLSNTEPFAMIIISIILFFVLAVYLWVRNSNT